MLLTRLIRFVNTPFCNFILICSLYKNIYKKEEKLNESKKVEKKEMGYQKDKCHAKMTFRELRSKFVILGN